MTKSVVIIGTRGYPSYYGGFETAVRRLAPYLADRGWSVTVYGRPGTTVDDDVNLDSRIERVVTRGIESSALSTLSYGFSSSIDARRRRPDVALVMNVANGFFLPLLSSAGIPSLVNVDGIEWERAKWGRVARGMFRLGARLTARHGNRMVYDSKAIAKRWADEFSLGGDFIPYGGDQSSGLPIVEGLRHRGYVLVVARFVPENTIPEFFEAVSQLPKTMSVVIVGSSGYDGGLDETAKLLAQENENIFWLGHVKDDQKLLSLWEHAAVYFHGHSVGGTNPALVQAMASGAPILARDTVYNREVLGDAGMYTSATPEDIVRNLLPFIEGDYSTDDMSRRARMRAGEEYSWDRVCAAYEESLIALIGNDAN